MLNRVDLLADAPTGIGKTAVGLSASLEAVLPNGGAALFLTARQSQHRAAIETSRYIWRSERVKVVDLISKQDTCLCRGRDGAIPCTEAGDCYFLDRDRVETAAQRLLEYPLHVGEAMRLCVRLGACPYLAARTALPSADLVVCDYNHVFSGEERPIQCDLDRPSGSIALVVDEAHNLPGRIMENHSRSLARSQLSPLLKGTGNRQFRTAVRTILDFIDRHAFERRETPIPPEELEEELQDQRRHGRCRSGQGDGRTLSRTVQTTLGGPGTVPRALVLLPGRQCALRGWRERDHSQPLHRAQVGSGSDLRGDALFAFDERDPPSPSDDSRRRLAW